MLDGPGRSVASARAFFVRRWYDSLSPERQAWHAGRTARDMADRAVSGVLAYELLLLLILLTTPYMQDHPLVAGGFIGAAMLVGIWRLYVIRELRRLGVSKPSTRGLSFGIGALLAATIWSLFLCVTIRLYPWDWPMWLTLFCSSGLAAGASTSLAPDLALARRYLLTLLAPAAVMLATSGTGQGLTLALIFSTYAGFLVLQTTQQFDVYWQAVREGELLVERNDEIRRMHAAHEVELETELERLKNHLLRVDRLATAGTLAGATGHELNNMSMILTAATTAIVEAARKGTAAGDKDIERLRRVESHVAVHARQLLSLGRPDHEEPGCLELCQVVRDTVEMLHAARRTRYVEVRLDLPPVPMEICATRTRIEQVLVNLVGNAVDALDEVIRPVKQVGIRVSLSAANGAELVIEDNGTGISPETLEQIFQPYFTTKAPTKGTGLGLPVVKQILEGLGGGIAVSSTPGVGTTFTITLPLWQGDTAALPVAG